MTTKNDKFAEKDCH